MSGIGLGANHGAGTLPTPLAGKGWGEGCLNNDDSPRGENPHPALRATLSRKRERGRKQDHPASAPRTAAMIRSWSASVT
ncbi:hypothetical protein XH96_13920 [Bradyrhizobium sp. CCBAU 51765]|nr:hypothetical protein XH96_13920 [Bradyrhizobium sp. CCBAU 51765]